MTLSVLGVSIGLLASTASAKEIHQHITLGDNLAGPPKQAVRVIDVAPADTDDDGCADTKDNYDGPGCDKPVVYSPGPQSPTATTQTVATTTPDYSSSGYAIPDYIVQCESGGDYSAVNSSSGAGGAYQIMPSTWQGLGYSGLPQDAPPAVQDAAAAELYAKQGAAPWACG